MIYTKEHIEDLVKQLKTISANLEDYNATDSNIRCRDLSIAYTHLEETILRLQKYLNT